MKRYAGALTFGLITCLLFYFMGAFIENSFDLDEWSMTARIFVGVMGMVCSVGVSILAYVFLGKEE